MGLRKCPKCEINYIRDDQQLCEVCSRKHKLSERDEEENEVILCAECGEHPAMKGKELCKYCYAESFRSERHLKKSASESENYDDEAENDEDAEDEGDLDDEEMEESDVNEADSEYDGEKEDYVNVNDYGSDIYADE